MGENDPTVSAEGNTRYMFEAPLTADGWPVVPGRAYTLSASPEAGPMAGRRVVAVGVDPLRGRALYVDAEDGDLIDAAPSSLLLSA